MNDTNMSPIHIHHDCAGEGEPLLLVAGLGGASSYWAPNLTVLSKHHRVVMHDHRGTGKSTRWEGEYSVEMMAEDLLRVMDRLQIEKAHLVGHSTGGAIGQVLGAVSPDRIASLVLYATWAERDALMERSLELRRRICNLMGTAEYHKATPLFLYPPHYLRDNSDRIDVEIEATIANSTTATILDARIKGILGFDGVQYHERIECPTLLLVTEDDVLTPPYSSELISRRIPHSEFVKIRYGGHALSRTEPETFNRIVLDFLSRHPIGQGVGAPTTLQSRGTA